MSVEGRPRVHDLQGAANGRELMQSAPYFANRYSHALSAGSWAMMRS